MKVWVLPLIALMVYSIRCAPSQQNGTCVSKNLKLVLVNSTLVKVVNSTSNTTSLKPGTGLCPKTKLQPPLKQNDIFIGVVGSEIDPLLAALSMEDLPAISAKRTDCVSNLPEICPLPGIVEPLINDTPTNSLLPHA